MKHRSPHPRRRSRQGSTLTPLLSISLATLALGCSVEDLLEAGGEPRATVSGDGTETGVFQGATQAHNVARDALGTGVALGALQWSDEISTFAQQWSAELAGRCGTIQHRGQDRYGENIALRGTTQRGSTFSAEEAVAGWVAEEACWTFGTIQGSERCDTACIESLNSNGCGHYTQVVWRDTQFVGCGYSTCQDDGYFYEIWVCNYDPPGNYIGQTPY